MSQHKLFIYLFFFVWTACLPRLSAAATPVSGVIAANTTWEPAGSPYVITSAVTVSSGVTLIVVPGTVIKFGSGGSLLVNGALSAVGASGSTIHFTDLRDDQVDGIDSNGNADPPAPGGWQGINVSAGGGAVFDFCSIRFGGGMINGNVYNYGSGSLIVSNSLISDSKTYGINYIDGMSSVGNITISNSVINNNGSDGINLSGSTGTISLSGNKINGNSGNGIFINSGSFTLQNNILLNNGSFGMRLMGGTLSSANGNSASGNTDGSVRMLANYLPSIAANTYTGKIEIDGGILSQSMSLVVGTPYVAVSNFEVGVTATLTAPAGTVVKFGSGAGINVSGTLNAVGIDGNLVHFTDLRDDFGGDTNGDGTASTPTAGGWNGISVNGSASLVFSSIRYASTNVTKFGAGSLTISNSQISNASGAGISISASAGGDSITDSTITNNGSDGLRFTGNSGSLAVTGNIITGNGGSGVSSDSGAMTLQNNNVTGNSGYALNLDGGTLTVPITGNIFSGNSLGAFRLMAEHLQPLSAVASSEKIVISGGIITSVTTLNATTPYVVDSIFTIGSTGILNVPAGTIMKFKPKSGIDVLGTLNASGVAGNPIYFTDLRDDSAGGDTNGDGPSAGVPGGWRGILITSGSTTLAYSAVRFGSDNLKNDGSGSITISNSAISNALASGIQLALSSASLSVVNSSVSYNGTDGISLSNSGGTISISGSTISYNTGRGIYTDGPGTNPTINNNIIAKNAVGVYAGSGSLPVIGGSATAGTGNSIFQNRDYGVQNLGTTNVNASYNWWGSSTGPRHTTNPSGIGNAVSNLVTFIPYLTTKTFTDPVASFTPELYDFKRIRVGVPSPAQNIIVTNIGSQALAFGPVVLSGSNPTEFQISSDTCSNASIAAGASCTVTVTFTPTSKQTFTAQLDFPAGGVSILPLYSVILTGTGFTPSALPFRDDFTSSYSPDWTNIRPYSFLPISVVAGGLHVPSGLSLLFDPSIPNGTTYNVLTLALPTGLNKLMVTTKLTLPAAYLDNFPQGGIVLFPEKNSQPDLSTYIRTQYRGLANPSTRAFQTTVDVNGTLNTNDGVTAVVDTVWLRLIRRGTSYQSLYSTDGLTFIPWHSVTLQQDVAYAGLFGFRELNSRATTSVDFDFFEVKALPTISVPASLTFGNVPQGTTQNQRSITVGNTGPGPLTVSSLTISGTNAAAFTAGLGTCSSEVPAGGSCSLSVALDSANMGVFSASLAIGSDDIDAPTVTVALSGSVTAPISLSVGILGTGGGTVRHAESNTACGTSCSVISTAGATATFIATPYEYSIFTVWGGSCSGSGACSFTAPGTTGGVTATFDRDNAHAVKIEPGAYFSTIMGAYGGAAATGTTTIKTWGTDYIEPLPLTFNLDKNILLDGGYDGTFATINGMTTVQGKMTVVTGATGGKVDVRNIRLKAGP